MEKTKPLHKSRVETRQLATMAMLVALAYVVTVVTRFPLMAAASFLKYDPKDVVLLIGAYLFGPMAGAAMSVATCFIEMITVSRTEVRVRNKVAGSLETNSVNTSSPEI